MKIVSSMLAALMLFGACTKQSSIYERETIPLEPAITAATLLPRTPPIPKPQNRCIYSYQDIVTLLGTGRTTVRSVILASGAYIQPGPYLAGIWYEAIPSAQSNSLFDSKLSAEWRYPDGYWQLSTANVWSLGCVYTQAGQPPYTNIIRGLDVIQINTCFYWSTNEHTGERVSYLVID